MRTSMPVALCALILSVVGAGCQADCGPPTRYNGLTYRTFANPVTWTYDNGGFVEGPQFWSYTSPANGEGQWAIEWGATAVGPVTVVIDGQPFEGTGEMNELECGRATVSFSGQYIDAEFDVEHNFNASASLNQWSEGPTGRMGALLVWKENWTEPGGQSGTFTSESHVSGELVAGR